MLLNWNFICMGLFNTYVIDKHFCIITCFTIWLLNLWILAFFILGWYIFFRLTIICRLILHSETEETILIFVMVILECIEKSFLFFQICRTVCFLGLSMYNFWHFVFQSRNTSHFKEHETDLRNYVGTQCFIDFYDESQHGEMLFEKKKIPAEFVTSRWE